MQGSGDSPVMVKDWGRAGVRLWCEFWGLSPGAERAVLSLEEPELSPHPEDGGDVLQEEDGWCREGLVMCSAVFGHTTPTWERILLHSGPP